jgi:hypothetical protein
MNGFLRPRKLDGVILAIVVGISAVHEAGGARAYLPTVGAPPLRFQSASTNHLVLDLKTFMTMLAERQAEASNALAQIAPPVAIATNTPAVVSYPASISSADTNPASVVTEGKNNSESPVIPPISPSSASDMLTVTPQMITEYLKPAQNQANQKDQKGAEVFVPAGTQFTPPAPKAPGESQATYKSQ